MNLLPVVLRLAGAEVSVYLIDQSEAFIEVLSVPGSR